MAKMVLWNKDTGEASEYEGVDAREILARSPDLYSTEAPAKKRSRVKNDPDGDGIEGAPQNVANVENEFRREPVGTNPPAQERDEVVIRNPVTDNPRMADPAGGDPNAGVVAQSTAANLEQSAKAAKDDASKGEAAKPAQKK
jgi:hypothetical protein